MSPATGGSIPGSACGAALTVAGTGAHIPLTTHGTKELHLCLANGSGLFGSKRAKFTGVQAYAPAKRQRRKSPYLEIQELESRTLLSVTASLTSGVLDVNLSAAQDSA